MNISNFKIFYQIYFIILNLYYKLIFIFYLMQMAIFASIFHNITPLKILLFYNFNNRKFLEEFKVKFE